MKLGMTYVDVHIWHQAVQERQDLDESHATPICGFQRAVVSEFKFSCKNIEFAFWKTIEIYVHTWKYYWK